MDAAPQTVGEVNLRKLNYQERALDPQLRTSGQKEDGQDLCALNIMSQLAAVTLSKLGRVKAAREGHLQWVKQIWKGLACAAHQGVERLRGSALEAAGALVHAQGGIGPSMHVPFPCIQASAESDCTNLLLMVAIEFNAVAMQLLQRRMMQAESHVRRTYAQI